MALSSNSASKHVLEEDLEFEALFVLLEEKVEKLQTGDGSLKEMLRLYEESMSVFKQCEKILNTAEQKVETLRVGADDGPDSS